LAVIDTGRNIVTATIDVGKSPGRSVEPRRASCLCCQP
jgi:hypothetical protein